jgi:integrase
MSRRRRSTGGILERQTQRGVTYHVRFRALGKRRSVLVGSTADGTTRRDAEQELAYQLHLVERGVWAPPATQEPVPEVPTFREAASDWFAGRKLEGGRDGGGLAPASVCDLEWRLGHLLRAFADTPLDSIDVAAVDAYRRRLVGEGKLGARSINRTLECLTAIIDEALEAGTIDGRNPVVGKRRRLKVDRPRRPYLDRAEQIEALLDAAASLDRESAGIPYRRAALATLVLGGLRIGEALNLRWSDVHLASARLRVRSGKTAAAARTVDLLPLLRDVLTEYKAAVAGADGDSFVFATRTGGQMNANNLRRRVLAQAVERANKQLATREAEPLPNGVTPHSLRRTFASLLFAISETPPYVMAQMGHTTPALTLAIYARQMDRRDGEPDRLKALVEGGRAGDSAVSYPSPPPDGETELLPLKAGSSGQRSRDLGCR